LKIPHTRTPPTEWGEYQTTAYTLGRIRMIIKTKIRLDYKDNKTARITFKALEPDNRGFIDGKIIGKSIIFKLESESIGSIRRSIDDLLVSEMIIEKIW